MKNTNVDAAEIAQFERCAERWWDVDGEMAPLHRINPARLDYIAAAAGGLHGRKTLDVGCGGGILSEALARAGAEVTGLDLASEALRVARAHAAEQSLSIDYVEIAVEAMAEQHPAHFDLVCCLEMLEHVPDPASVVRACARLVKPGGTVVFSTINRNPKAFGLAIVAAEYLLNLVPRGTHEYARFIRPSELAGWARDAGLTLHDVSGLRYNPVTRTARIVADDVDVNYLMHCRRPETT